MNFNQVFESLFKQEKIVEYTSLVTTDKVHKRRCTIPKKFQTESDKIIVWDLDSENYHDIQIDTIISIQNV